MKHSCRLAKRNLDLGGLTTVKTELECHNGIMQRAVKRVISRRESVSPKQLGIDETAFKKCHDDVTIISDSEAGTVLHVGQDRKKASLKSWYSGLSKGQKEAIESVSMDMWPAFIHASLERLPNAKEKIAFDKFHVAKYLGETFDKVRRQENKALMAEGRYDLKGSQYKWLYSPKNMSRKQKSEFKILRDGVLKTARAWAIKEFAMSLWHHTSKTWADKGWKKWLSWAVRSRLEPIKKVARTIKEHLWGILNAIVLKVSNGPAEGLNSRIKIIKVRSRGFRNKERFSNAIYFHLGGLDLYPKGVLK